MYLLTSWVDMLAASKLSPYQDRAQEAGEGSSGVIGESSRCICVPYPETWVSFIFIFEREGGDIRRQQQGAGAFVSTVALCWR